MGEAGASSSVCGPFCLSFLDAGPQDLRDARCTVTDQFSRIYPEAELSRFQKEVKVLSDALQDLVPAFGAKQLNFDSVSGAWRA